MPAAATATPTEYWEHHPNPFVRLIGRTPGAGTVLAQAARQNDARFRIASRLADAQNESDYTQIDLPLPMARDDGSQADPLPNTSYAGFTPVQRRRFAVWLAMPDGAAPAAFRQLYLAWLECALFEEEKQTKAIEELVALLAASGWQTETRLAHVALLAGWISQDSELVARGLAHGSVAPQIAPQIASPGPSTLFGVGAGWLAQWGIPLDARCAVALAQGWHLPAPALADFQILHDGPLLDLRITSLANSLGADPLAWAWAEQRKQTADIEWLPWRCTHRGLRIALPQVNLRPFLEPCLTELIGSLPVTAAESAPQPEPQPAPPTDETPAQTVKVLPKGEWTLLLEFGESRSQHYDHVLHLARKQPGYQMLMDETRHLVHRVRYGKRHMRQFWRLWAYVENWSTTKVYVNGEEVSKWNVFPYSAEMR